MLEEEMRQIAENFESHGASLVAMIGYAEGTDLHYRCFAAVPKEIIYQVLKNTASNLSLMPHDLASVMNGDIVAQPPDMALCALVRQAANKVDMHEPMILMALKDGQFASFVVGDVPMLVYMATRMLTTLQDVGVMPGSFYTSDN